MPLTARIPQSQPTRGHTMELWQRTQLFNANSVSPDLYRRFYDDFQGDLVTVTPSADLSNDASLRNWWLYADFTSGPTAAGIHPLATATSDDAQYGAIVLDGAENTGASDNHAIVLQASPGKYFRVSDAAAQARKLAFECRFRVNNVANDIAGFFIGLAQSGLTAATGALLATNADALATNISALGFLRPAADGDGLDVIARDAGDTGVTTAIANGITLVADTWYKAGFLYEPEAGNDSKISFWLDGVESGTRISSATIAGANFPDADWMVPTIGLKQGSTTGVELTVDWIDVLQEYE